MKIFDSVVEEVKQSGKRKGALKIDLPVSHPEIFDFIHCKDDITQLKNMNISVSITNDFLEAVDVNGDWNLVFDGEIYDTVKAKDLWNEIMTSAWKTGEPGISYQDNMNAGNMNPHLGDNVYGNPCHEFVNIPYSSCNLASVNLSKCVTDGKLDLEKLQQNVMITFRFLDDMITMNKLPLPKIEEVTKSIRPIGLGTMGLADLLYQLQIPYNSTKALKFIDNLYKSIRSFCIRTNANLASEKGTYPAYSGSRWEEDNIEARCSSMLSIAPNGSIAIIAGTTGGIEPEFALVYERITTDGAKYFMVNKVFEQYLKQQKQYTDDVLNRIIQNKGSIHGLDDLFPKDIQKVFVVASDVSPEWHVKVLAAIQQYVDLSCSKTVNMPSEASVSDVAHIYSMAGKMGIKGLTVYRDGCREGQVLSVGNQPSQGKAATKPVYDSVKPISRKKLGKLSGTTDNRRVACGDLYITVNKDSDGCIVETFINTSKNGICKSNIDGLNRMVSLALRSGVQVDEIIDQLHGIKCPACTRLKGKGEPLDGQSCADCIAQRIGEEYRQTSIKPTVNESGCPECGTILTLSEGCRTCSNCGWSKCS